MGASHCMMLLEKPNLLGFVEQNGTGNIFPELWMLYWHFEESRFFFCDITNTEPKNHQCFPVQSFICAMICVICPKCFIFLFWMLINVIVRNSGQNGCNMHIEHYCLTSAHPGAMHRAHRASEQADWLPHGRSQRKKGGQLLQNSKTCKFLVHACSKMKKAEPIEPIVKDSIIQGKANRQLHGRLPRNHS